MSNVKKHQGSCLCGEVSFIVEGDLPHGDGCHCIQCRKWTGHFLAGTDVPQSSVEINGEENITWYQSSEKVRRGFCKICGSSLFWNPIHKDWIGISLGAFDNKTETKLGMHIFIKDKGDYYELGDDVPQFERFPTKP